MELVYGLLIDGQEPLVPPDDGTMAYTQQYDTHVEAGSIVELCNMHLANGDSILIRAQNDNVNMRECVYVTTNFSGVETQYSYQTNWQNWLNPVALASYIDNTDPAHPLVYIELWGIENPPAGEWESIDQFGPWAKDDALSEIEIEEWDDTPQADGETTEDNFGGAFADLDPYNFTQDIPWPDLDLFESLDPYNSDGGPGLFTPYIVSESDLATMGKCLYSDDMFNALCQHLDGSANPVNGILRCFTLPFGVNTAVTGKTNIGMYGKPLYYQNLVENTVAQGYHFRFGGQNSKNFRYTVKSFGVCTCKEVWGTARDYTDTTIAIYLPYVGMRQLDAALVVGKTLELRMYVDCWTGDFLYLLHAGDSDIGGKFFSSSAFIGRWSGNCSTEIPIGRMDVGKPLNALLGATAAVAAAPFTGGMSLAFGAGSLGNIIQNGLQTSGNTSGNLTGTTGIMDCDDAYLLIQRAVPDYPVNWRGEIGAVRHQTYLANDLSGFTLFEDIKLIDMEGASGEEIEELKRELCSEGIIL